MEFFKKATIGIFLGLSLSAFVIIGLFSIEERMESKVLTLSSDQTISIQARQSAYQPMLIAPYKSMDIFLSNEENPGFEFTSVGGTWEEVVPNGTNLQAEVRFKVSNKWTEWLELEEEEDMIQDDKVNPNSVRKFGMASSNPATAMQYRFIMYGDGKTTPLAINPQWTFIKAAPTVDLKAPPKPSFSAIQGVSEATYAALNTAASSKVITRKQWGANETYRYMVDNNEDPELVELNPELYEKYKNELVIARTVKTDADGKKYSWPLQYPEKVKKFVIHHTATTTNLNDPQQAIRDIYYYHAITRAWGDIGYNYIVDLDGKVYEGRYGGEGVIGAHSGLGNNGSIGIAVLGNFETTEVPEKVVGSLANLVATKSKIHGIDPTASSTFRGSKMPNVFGHKDIMSTTCPGIYLYEKLPVIRSLAKETKTTPEKEKFKQDYDYIDRSELYFTELSQNETSEITFKLENIGKLDWNSSTYLVIDKNSKFTGVVSFPDNSTTIKATMQEKTVKPGQIATFKLKVKGGNKSEIVYLNAAPMINGTVKGKEYVVVPLTTQQADYRYKLISTQYPPKTMKPGEEYKAWVKLENTGNVTWKKTGENTVMLGTDQERDRVSKLVAKPSSRIGYLQEDSVPPGKTGTFNISIKAPETPGYYKEYFTPVVEGVTWMTNSGMYFETTVSGGAQYGAEVVEVGANKDWQQGKSYLVRVRIRNLGQAEWTKENFSIPIMKENDLEVTDLQLASGPIKAGEVGTITMVAKVSANETVGKKSIIIKPTVKGQQLLTKPIYIYYNVVKGTATTTPTTPTQPTTPTPTQPTSNKGENIRVKLGFTGNPEISANSSLNVYSGATLLGTLGANTSTTVTKEKSQYKVKIGDKTHLKSEPIRFISSSTAILKINNFENRPAWNQDLNDNQYRGTLEVRTVDDKLVVINELPLEDYLKGLGEVSNSETPEKIKAIIVAARTYAKYYMDVAEKFPGKPYDLDDNPEVSQKYLGYGLEKRSPNVAAGVTATQGEVVTYKGNLVKTPYFNNSDGKATKSAESVWGWKDTPYLVSVKDTYCTADKFAGHGVGLSGCGAKGMAEAGKKYKEILKYYYTGVEVTDLY